MKRQREAKRSKRDTSKPVAADNETQGGEDDEGKSQAHTMMTDGKTYSTTDQRRGESAEPGKPPTLSDAFKKNKGYHLKDTLQIASFIARKSVLKSVLIVFVF